MNAGNPSDIAEIVQSLHHWTPEMKRTLAAQVLASIDVTIPEPPRRIPFDRVVGLLRTGHAPPNDEQCEAILAEQRARKYDTCE
jgi:hypothetical protein